MKISFVKLQNRYNHLKPLLFVSIALLFSTTPTKIHAQQITPADRLTGPDAVTNILHSNAQKKGALLDIDWLKDYDDWREELKNDIGLDFSLELNMIGLEATSSPGEDFSASQSLRFITKWDIVDRNGPNTGSLVVKLEHRYSYTDVPPTEFGFEIGYAGLLNGVFNDQGWRLTHGHWRQKFADGHGVFNIGFLDITDYADVFLLANPWSGGFSNVAFETSSNAFGDFPDGALGAMAGGFVTDNIYMTGLIVDANAKANDPMEGFNNLMDFGETFKSIEIGWASNDKELLMYTDNFHLTFYQVDERTPANAPEGYGVAFSFTKNIDDTWLPFVRGGLSEGGESVYEASLAVGFGYSKNIKSNLTGVGLHWGKPNIETFGNDLRDQWTFEAFQMWQLTHDIQITPDIQLIVNPALSPDTDFVAVFGMRVRMVF